MPLFSEQIFKVKFYDEFTVPAAKSVGDVTNSFKELVTSIETAVEDSMAKVLGYASEASNVFSGLGSQRIEVGGGITAELKTVYRGPGGRFAKSPEGPASQFPVGGIMSVSVIKSIPIDIANVLDFQRAIGLLGMGMKIPTPDEERKSQRSFAREVAGGIFSKFTAAFALGGLVSSIFAPLMEMMQVVFAPFVREFGPVMFTIAMAMQELVRSLMPAIHEMISTLLPAVSQMVQALLPPIAKMISVLLPMITWLTTSVAGVIENVLVPVIEKLASFIDSLVRYFKGDKYKPREMTISERQAAEERMVLGGFREEVQRAVGGPAQFVYDKTTGAYVAKRVGGPLVREEEGLIAPEEFDRGLLRGGGEYVKGKAEEHPLLTTLTGLGVLGLLGRKISRVGKRAYSWARTSRPSYYDTVTGKTATEWGVFGKLAKGAARKLPWAAFFATPWGQELIGGEEQEQREKGAIADLEALSRHEWQMRQQFIGDGLGEGKEPSFEPTPGQVQLYLDPSLHYHYQVGPEGRLVPKPVGERIQGGFEGFLEELLEPSSRAPSGGLEIVMNQMVALLKNIVGSNERMARIEEDMPWANFEEGQIAREMSYAGIERV